MLFTFKLYHPCLQGCQVADLSAIFADFGLMEELLAEKKKSHSAIAKSGRKWPN
jgi:hypothetical protein